MTTDAEKINRLKKYMEEGAYRCPVCLSQSISADGFDTDGAGCDVVYQNVHCDHCGAAWTEYFKIFHVDLQNEGTEGFKDEN